MGYNPADNLMYAVCKSTVYRIGYDGTTAIIPTDLSNVGTPIATYYDGTGDFDGNGHFWFYKESNGQWFKLDLIPGSATYGKILAQGFTAGATAPECYFLPDWAYLPGQGNYMYALSTGCGPNTKLQRFSLTTHTWSTVATYPVAGGWAAQWGSSQGDIYGIDNNSGRLGKFSVTGTYTLVGLVLPEGKIVSIDGARCNAAPIP